MKELIYVTGQIESPFCTNEINHFCSIFDQVHVIAYNGDKVECDLIAKKNGFTYDFVLSKFKLIANLIRLPRWSKRKYVKDEVRKNARIFRDGIQHWMYVMHYGLYSLSVEKIINEHLASGNDIYLYSFWLSRPAFAIASMNINRAEGLLRIVSRTHRYDLYEEENAYKYLPFREFIAENLDTIYFSSWDTIDYYRGKKYTDFNNQSHGKLAYLGTNNPEHIKRDLNSDEIVIVSCAYIIPRKRLDLIIKVVEKMSKLNVKVKWIHIGNGETEEEIKELAKKQLSQTDVDYEFTGKLRDEEIYELYYRKNADFFINMSDSEGIPVSIIEALSMGIPAIARNVGGNIDAVIDGVDGILIEKESIKEEDLDNLAKKIVNYYNNKEEFFALSRNAVSHWRKMFSGERNAINVCKDIIDDATIERLF